MSHVNVQKIRDAEGKKPLLQETLAETLDLLDRVRKRAFELFEKRGGATGSDIGDWLQAEKEVFQVPEMELAESPKEFDVRLALPGFGAGDIRVSALPDAVIVDGEAAHQDHGADGSIRFCEFGERRVFRLIPLPEPADVDRVSANLDKGILHIRVAKAEREKNKSAAA